MMEPCKVEDCGSKLKLKLISKNKLKFTLIIPIQCLGNRIYI
jgi:hypothetical protein